MSSAAPTIFISIAAYQDKHLWWTVNNAWQMATKPGRLRFGVVDQSVESARAEHVSAPWAGQVRYVHLHPKYARGPCWARAIAYSLWNEETYLLQIDSHMWFESGWDERLIQEMLALRLQSGHSRHIVSTYPAAFEFKEGEPVSAGSPSGVLVLRPRADASMKPDNPVMMFEAVPTPATHRIAGYHVGAGCLFSLGNLLQEVPYDPWLYFHGEEQNLAVRAWTRGWDVWHPVRMPILHLYKPAGGPDIVHWSPDENKDRDFHWTDLEKRAARHLAQIFYTQTVQGAYGLGTTRTLEAYALASGIDYKNKTVDRAYVIPREAPPAPPNFGTGFGAQTEYTFTVKLRS